MMKWMRERRRTLDGLRAGTLIAIGVTLALSSCREPTQITLELSTDVSCADVHDTSVSVGTLSSVKSKPPVANQNGCKSSKGRIGSLVVVPSGEGDEEVTIQVITGVSGQVAAGCDPVSPGANCIVARRALRFVPHTSLELPIELAASCLGKICPEDQTCLDGQCVSAKLTDPGSCATPGGCGPKLDAGDAGKDASQDVLVDSLNDVLAEGEAGPDPSLVLHYDFEAGNAQDLSGNGNDGVLAGATVATGVGRNGSYGLVLTELGTSTLQIGPSASLAAVNQDTGATVTGWLNLTKAPAIQGFIFDQDPFGTDSLEAWIAPTAAVCVDAVETNGGTHYPFCETTPLPIGTWTHFAITADATTARLYIGGVSVATSQSPAPHFALVANSFFGYEWEGVMDDLYIYKRVLSQLEIASLASQ